MPATRRSVPFAALPLLVVVLGGCASSPAIVKPVSDPTPTDSKPLPAGPAQGTQAPVTAQESFPPRVQPSAPEPNTLEYVDLWERIRQGYKLSNPDSPKVLRQLEWYTSDPQQLYRVQEQARPYLHFIVEELEKRDMPLELALLPVVESAYRPLARSSRRAVGLWQFIPSTGRMYGLRQNWWYDGRRDILASTEAALNYLEALAKRFDDDWELALAAYNAGAGTVRRAMRKNAGKGKPTDYWSLELPRETRRYVPRLLALARIVEDPARYQITLMDIADQPYFSSVAIESQLDLRLASEMAGIELEEIYRLNPGFKRWATAPQGPHRLVLPLGHIDDFTDRLEQLEPDQLISWTSYRIREGDTLGAIAHRHGITLADLKQSNRLRGDRIRAGHQLLIPASHQRSAGPPPAAAGDLQLTRGQEIEPGRSKIIYTVRQGDSLWDIARNYRVSHRKLARWNGISTSDTLHPGQKLVLWIEKPAVTVSATGLDTGGKSGGGPAASDEAI